MRTLFGVFSLLATAMAFADCATERALSAEKIGARLAELRAQKGHFEGGQWQAALDRWQGEKHCLLQLGAALALGQQASPQQVQVLLGVADRTSALAHTSGRPSTSSTLPAACGGGHTKQWLWYRWRGERDSMLLEFSQNKLHNINWCLSHE